MAFEQNVFISYAHIDNQPLSQGEKGWISRFHAALEAMLSMRLGAAARIWRDDKLHGNDVFGAEIAAQFPKTAMLISILSPRYVESEWCKKELHEFCVAAERSTGVRVDNQSRVVKVVKFPVESQDSLPTTLKDQIGYEFYTIDEEERTPLELDPAYGPKLAETYNRRLSKLAIGIVRTLKALSTSSLPAKSPTAAPKPVVYLAECSYDLREAREALETDLRMHGYSVLPEHALPRDEVEYVAAVKPLLERAALAVHLVGSQYGSVPDGPSQKSVVVLQNELAAAQSRERGLRRILWLPAATRQLRPDQQAFLDLLQGDAEAQVGADLMKTDLEALKAATRNALEKLEKLEKLERLERLEAAAVASKPAPAAPGSKLVYLICDVNDRKATLPLRKLFIESGIEVAIPSFTGDAATVRAANENLIASCNAAVVYYGAGDEAWQRTVQSDLRKASAYRTDKSPLPVFTFLAAPNTDDKSERIALAEANLIDGLGVDLGPESIQPIVAALGSA